MKKAIRRLMRGADGRVKVVYIDLETLQLIYDLTGYEVVNEASNHIDFVRDVDDEEEVITTETSKDTQFRRQIEEPSGDSVASPALTAYDLTQQNMGNEVIFEDGLNLPNLPEGSGKYIGAGLGGLAGTAIGGPVGGLIGAGLGGKLGERIGEGEGFDLPPAHELNPRLGRAAGAMVGGFIGMQLAGPLGSAIGAKLGGEFLENTVRKNTFPPVPEAPQPTEPAPEQVPEEPVEEFTPATEQPVERRGLAALVPDQTGVTYYNPGQEIGMQREPQEALSGLSEELERPIGILSGFRDEAYNRQVGGAPRSKHTEGLAADIDMSGMSEGERAKLVQELTQRGASGFITYTEQPDVLHVDWGPRPAGERGTINRLENPLEPPHFMHDRTVTRLDKAPGWFQKAALTGGITYPEIMDKVPSPAPREVLTAQEQLESIDKPQGFTSFLSEKKDKSVAQKAIDSIITDTIEETTEDGPRPQIGPSQNISPRMSEYTGFTSPEAFAQVPEDATAAQMAALGYGFNDLTDDELSQIATVLAGELSPQARASIASGEPDEEAVEAMGGILSTIANRAASKETSLVEEAYRPRQFSAVNPEYLQNTLGMYRPVAEEMDRAVQDYFTGGFASNFGLQTAVPNPTTTSYYANYVDPYWASAMRDVSKDSTGHIFGYLPEYGDVSATERQRSEYAKDRRGYQAAEAFSDRRSGFEGPSRFGTDYIDSPAYGMTGARGGFASSDSPSFRDTRTDRSYGYGGGRYGLANPDYASSSDFPSRSRSSSSSGFSDTRSDYSSGFGTGSYGISTPSGGYASSTGGSSTRGGFNSDTYGGSSPMGSGTSPSGPGGALSGI